MTRMLTAVGASVKGLNLGGRFHCACYGDDVKSLLEFCDRQPGLVFAEATELSSLTWDNIQGSCIQDGKLHKIAIEGILTSPSNWNQTYNSALSTLPASSSLRVVSFGLANSLPQTLSSRAGTTTVRAKDYLTVASQQPLAHVSPGVSSYQYAKETSGEEIAVVGMACKVVGADDLAEFWDVLCRAESQHREIKDAFRSNFETAFRQDSDQKRKWFGNFIEDADAFDHKFWRKSPRDAASTDPQQRLMMSVALQAVIQAGYFHAAALEDAHVGCYLGIGNVDYEENINCHEPTAFMATGNLRSFIAGKISHALGWTGPALTIDTACSSSGVAVHQACRAILSGECTAALAGGAAIMTSPRMFQDLAAASFLSPTGPCKSFDTAADGYCRGDGVGAVFLKKMSQAITDGDQIYGVIASTAVYQNQNSTAITVPNSTSLSGLFGDVAKKSLVRSSDVTYVEAHGTGTQVGDPAEYEGIRRTFGGPQRNDTLTVGSVKSVVGHTEGAAGIVSLIKVLLMMNEGHITPQANFKTVNPSINHKASDNMQVATQLKPWDPAFRVAMINSYGASGSNASMLVTEAPRPAAKLALETPATTQTRKHPFWFCALDERSLQAYAVKFLGFLVANSISATGRSIANLSFNVARQTNRWLPRALVFSCSNVDELTAKLSAYVNGDSSAAAVTRTVIHPDTRPVILCFGGQVSTFVGLDISLYASVDLLRENLDECDACCRSLGFGSVFPLIFQRTPIENTVMLQVTLFSMQYATATCWTRCGLPIAAVVGHSFGELTALCVSGVLSLEHALRFVSGRSRLIRDSWGADRGAMMAVEGREVDVLRILHESNAACSHASPAAIACFNGPTSFTVAGSTEAVKVFEETIAHDTAGSQMRTKKLNVTNAFHSTLVKPLMTELEKVGRDLEFKEPRIPFERATESPTAAPNNAHFVADHLRNPVFFNHAVQRLSSKYPNAVWLEAGSNSTITSMASRALGAPREAHFQPINLTSDNFWEHLADATMKLWKEGINVPFWPHHAVQTTDYAPLILPPYQFEKVSHWLGRKLMSQAQPQAVATTPMVKERPKGLWSLQAQDGRSARFKLHTSSDEFAELMSGVQVVSAPSSVPISMQLHVITQTHLSLRPESERRTCLVELCEYQSHKLLALDTPMTFWLDTKAVDASGLRWTWRITGETTKGTSSVYATGDTLLHTENRPSNGFENYERLIAHDRCTTLLEHPSADAGIQGRSIYQTLDSVTRYSDMHRGLQKVVSKGNECAARLAKTAVPNQTWVDLVLAEAVHQVPSMFMNFMFGDTGTLPWTLSRVGQWMRSAKLPAGDSGSGYLDIYSTHRRSSDNEWVADVFIFDQRSGTLTDIMLGIHFQQTREAPKFAQPDPPPVQATKELADADPVASPQASQLPAVIKEESHPDIDERIFDVLADLSGLDVEDIRYDSELPDLGIDSLMSMELARDIEKAFECSLVLEDMNEVVDVQSLIDFVRHTLGAPVGDSKADSPASATPTSSMDSKSSGKGSSATTKNSSLGDYSSDLSRMPQSVVWETFQESKIKTDDYIAKHDFAGYSDHVMPKQTELCIVHILDAFDQLDCSLRAAKPGQKLVRVKHHPRHERFVNFIYNSILSDSGTIAISGTGMTRTTVPLPTKSAGALFKELMDESPEHSYDHRLTYLAGCRLAEVFADTCDGIQLLFTSPEGREAVTGMYSTAPVNVVWIKQMEDLLRNLLAKLPARGTEPLKIFELGAGTGGTTAKMVDILANMDVPVEYTVTDLSPSLVAAARKRFKGHKFLKYQAYDIEAPPSADLIGSQHIVFATNCVHATHSLVISTANIRSLLRSDGFLLMLEMTELIPWIDLVFGTLEGWWLFDDGREHALAKPEVWRETLQAVGYGDVDWTGGERPEANIQRLILAMAS